MKLNARARQGFRGWHSCLGRWPAGGRRPSWGLAGVVAVICTGLLLLVAGETRFDLTGFLVVMTASMLAGFRWTITQVLLQGDRHAGARPPLLSPYTLKPPGTHLSVSSQWDH